MPTKDNRTGYYDQHKTEYWQEINKLSASTGKPAEWWHTIISFETMGTFDPSIKSTKSSATGLIQFLEATAKELGTTTAKLREMSYSEQFPYVEKYFWKKVAANGNPVGMVDLYLLIHWPKAVNKPEYFVLYKKGSDNYAANQVLDKDKDGVVTKLDVVNHIQRRFNTLFPGIAQNYCVVSQPTSVEPDTCFVASPIQKEENDITLYSEDAISEMFQGIFSKAKNFISDNLIAVAFGLITLGTGVYAYKNYK